MKNYPKTILTWQVASALAVLSTGVLAFDDLTNEGLDPARTDIPVSPGDNGGIRANFVQTPNNSNAINLQKHNKFIFHGAVKGTLTLDSGGKEDRAGTFLNVQFGGDAQLQGNVDIEGRETNVATSVVKKGGLNLLYVTNWAHLTVGTPETTTKLLAFAKMGDALSAKVKSTLTLLSTKNQIVGNVDLVGVKKYDPKTWSIEQDFGVGSKITMTLAGEDSFWFGNERSFDTGAVLDEDENPNQEYTVGGKVYLEYKKPPVGTTEIKLTDGAQWSYVNRDGYDYMKTMTILGITVKGFKVYPKTLSSLTLQNGGTVNLNDADLKAFWEKQGFADKHPLMKDPIEHDYAIIRKLDGDGGIIKLDINATNRDESDLIVVGQMTGNHFIEVADPNGLEGITEATPLLFGLTSGEGTFAAKTDKLATPVTNVELKIEKRDELVRPTEDSKMLTRFEAPSFFTSGLKPWYITTKTFKPTPNVEGITNVGRSFMNQFLPYESLDTRYGYEVEASRDCRPWVRLWGTTENYRFEHFKTDAWRLAVGWSRPWGEFHRVGAMIEGMKATSRFENQTYAKAKAYGLRVALTDLYDRPDWYLDSKLEAGWMKQKADPRTQPDLAFSWGQWAWGGSIEAGYRFKNDDDYFVTPQVQVSARYVPRHSTEVDGISIKQDSSLYAITREGVRFGKNYPDYSISAHVDFLQRWGKFGQAGYSDRYTTHRRSWLGTHNWIEVGLNGHWRVKPNHQLALRVGGEIDKARSQAFFGMLEWSYRY